MLKKYLAVVLLGILMFPFFAPFGFLVQYASAGPSTSPAIHYSIAEPFDIKESSFLRSSEISNLSYLFFDNIQVSTDGTKGFISGGGTGIYEFNLGTPFDFSTAGPHVYYTTMSNNGQLKASDFFTFSRDGLKLFTGTSSGLLSEYSLTNPFDLQTVTYKNGGDFQMTSTKGISNQDFSSLSLSKNGDYIYAVDTNGGNIVVQYQLTTPYNISTATNYQETSFVGSTSNDASRYFLGGQISDDGTKMHFLSGGYYPYKVFFDSVTLAGPHDISSLTLDTPKDVTSDLLWVPRALGYDLTGKNLYVLDFRNPNSNVAQFVMNSPGFSELTPQNSGIVNPIGVAGFRLEGEVFQDTDNDDLLDVGTEVIFPNMPAGLTPLITLTDNDTKGILTLTGAANSHENMHDLSQIMFQFTDQAFVGGDASAIMNSGHAISFNSDLSIDFNDNNPPTELTLSSESIKDGLPAGIVATASASDLDSASILNYSFATGAGDVDNGSFTLSSTGVLRSIFTADASIKDTYNIRVQVSDGIDTVQRSFTLSVKSFVRAAGVNSDLSLWLRADNGTSTTANGGAVGQWNDQSLNANNVSQSVQAYKPSFITNSINFNPVVRFDNLNKTGLIGNISNGFQGNQEHSIYIVSKEISAPSWSTLFSIGPNGSTSSLSSKEYISYIPVAGNWDNLKTWGGLTTYKFSNIGSWSIDSILSGTGGTNTTTAYFNGEVINGGISNASVSWNFPSNPIVSLGVNTLSSSATYGIGAEISEILVYPKKNSVVEDKKINSYLGLKYGITLDSSVGDYLDTTGASVYNFAADTNYQSHIVGLAKDKELDQRISTSQGTGSVLTLTTDDNTSDFTSANGGSRTQMADGEYVVLASNSGALTSSATSITGYDYKIARQWRAEVTNYTGAVNAKFDIPVISGTDWDLVQSDTSDFSDAGANLTKVADLDTNGETLDVTFVDGKYYSILESNIVTPNIKYEIGEPYSLANIEYNNVNFFIGNEENIPNDIEFSSDGLMMFVMGPGSDSVYAYDLSSPYDISSAIYTGKSFSLAAQDTSPNSTIFSPDGLKMFITGTLSESVHEYTLTIPYDISTASYLRSQRLSAQSISASGIKFNPTGTKMYMVGFDERAIYEYSLTSAYDTSTASYANKSYSFNPQNARVADFEFNPNGTKLFAVDFNSDRFLEYVLTTPFDISSMAYLREYNVTEESGLLGLAISGDGRKMYGLGFSEDRVFEYGLIDSSNNFTENTSNNGTVSGKLGFTLFGDTFSHTGSQTTLTEGVDFILPNKPAGLTANLNLKLSDGATDPVSANTATAGIITFSGSATAHTTAQNVSGLTIRFTDTAFTNTAASGILNSGDTTPFNTNASIDFLPNAVPSDITLSGSSINENVGTGTTVGTLSTTDTDVSDTHTYSFSTGAGDTDNGSFILSGSLLRINVSPDFETQSSYSVRIETNDGNGGTFQKALTISVVDLDEIAPVAPTLSLPTDFSPLTGTGEVDSVISVYSSTGTLLFTGSVSSTGSFSITPSVIPTVFPLTVTSTDAAGNESSKVSVTGSASDLDGDSILNTVEDSALNNGDANGDGIMDRNQGFVASVPNVQVGNGAYITLQTDNVNCKSIRKNESLLDSRNDTGYKYPLGLLNFQIECLNPGDSTTVTILYEKQYDTTGWVYRKQDGGSFRTLTGVTFGTHTYASGPLSGTTVTKAVFTVTDGDSNTDDDNLAKFITDPSGPAVISLASTSSSRGASGGSIKYSCHDSKALNYSTKGFPKLSLCEYATEGKTETFQNDLDINTDTNLKQKTSETLPIVDYDLEKTFSSCPIVKGIQGNATATQLERYNDIAENPYKKQINKFSELGIIQGYEDKSFGPKNMMTRSEFLKVALKAHCSDYSKADTSALEFVDVDRESWQARVIAYALDKGMIHGDIDAQGRKTFRPNDVISKIEATKILMRFSGIGVKNPEPLAYKDISTPWHKTYVQTGQTLGLFEVESDDDFFLPDDGFSREKMIDLVDRLVNLYNK